MELASAIIVALISFSPVGEELIAIPAGIAMGLPVFTAAAVAVSANFLPVPLLFFIFDRGNRYPGVRDWLSRRRSDKIKRWMDRYGVLGLFIITPWTGVYAAAITCELLGMERARIYGAIAAGLLAYAAVLASVISFGMG